MFEYSENMYLESVTVSGHYTTGEILQKAGLNTILGMGTVFIVLIFLCFIIWLFNFIPVLEKKFRKKETEEPVLQTAAQPDFAAAGTAAPAGNTDDQELAAVIAAAIAAAEGTSTDDFIVRSIKRRKTNKWK